MTGGGAPDLDLRIAALEIVLANVRHGIVLWDEHHRIVMANEAASVMLDAPPGLIVPGRTLQDLVEALLESGTFGTGQRARTLARWLLDQDRSKPFQERRITKDGRVLEVRSDPTPQGGFTTTMIDITTTHEAEEAMRLTMAASEAANVSKSRFLAAMGSELRTPLMAMMAEMAALSRDASGVRARQLAEPPLDGLDAAEVQHSCDSMIDTGRRLLGMIDTILDVARLEAGRFELTDDVLDLPQLVRLCVRQSDGAAAAGEVTLFVALPSELPRIRADERRMRQALSHLVSNAVKFTAATGSVRIEAQVESASGDLLLTVRDTGVGMGQEDLERVFEPFTTVVDTSRRRKRRDPGGGLGLYISRTLLRAHGGDVVLESAPGRGTTAVLRIPADRVLRAEGTASP